jgi:hypothetical protein
MSWLDTKYEKPSMDANMSTLDHLSSNQQQQSKSFLYKFEHVIDGTLGDLNTNRVSFKGMSHFKIKMSNKHTFRQSHYLY